MNYSCPIGTFQGTYDLPVRHGIDFSGITDLKKINLPEKLTTYKDFLYNKKTRRISFKVARLSYCATRAKWFEEGRIYQKGIFFSVDPQIHTFNKIFLDANPNIKFTDKDPNGIQTYDYVDKEDDQAGAIKFFIDLKKIFNAIPEKINTSLNVVLIGVVGITLLKFFEVLNKNRTTKND
jgi:hypothetical protein